MAMTLQGDQFVYAKLPNGSYAKFKKGTTPDQMKQMLTQKGLLKPAAQKTAPAQTTPQSEVQLKPFAAPSAENLTWKHAGEQALTGVKELGQSVANVAKDVAKNPNWLFGHESVFQHVITDPAAKQALEANAAWKLHQYDRAGIHELAGMLPLVGPWVGELYEQSVTGDPVGALAKGESQMLTGELAGKVVGKAKLPTAESLRTKAGRLEMQATGTDIPEKALDPTEAARAGRAMAEAKVIGTKLTLPRKLAELVKQKGAQVDQAVKQADAVGKIADVTQSLDTAVDTAKQRAAALGNKKALSDLNRWKLQQSANLDPKTGQWSPRNMTKVMPSELLRQSRVLEHDAGWEGGPTPDHISNAAKMYRKALNDHLDQAAPGTAKLRADEAQLINNRDAAKAAMGKNFEGTKATFVSYFRSPGTLAAYALLKGLGASWIGAIAPVVGMKTMWDSTLSRTTRAAILQHASEIIDGRRVSAAARGGSPPTSGASANAVPPSTTPPPTPGVTSTQPQQSPQQMLLEAAPTIQAVVQAKQLLPPSAPVEHVMAVAQQVKAVKALQAAVGATAPQTAVPQGEAPTGPQGAAKPLQASGLQPTVPQVTKVGEGISGLGPKAKAMMDRLDELTARTPKSGKERQDTAREIEEIKKLADAYTTKEEASAIKKRITDREHIARKRATARAETPGASSVGAREATAPGGNPEQQTMLIDAGLSKLKTFGDLGKATAGALARDAKLRKWSVPEQMAQITEAIEFLQSQQHHEGGEIPLHPPGGDDEE